MNAFAQLLSQEEAPTFLSAYWEQKSLLSTGDVSRWPFTFSRDRFLASLDPCLSVRMVYKNAEGLHREAPISASSAHAIYDAGASICAARVERGHPDLRTFVEDLQAAFAYPVEFHMNGYLSPSGEGFGTHFDDHSVWILQVEGTKRWFFAEAPEVQSPLTNFIYPTHDDVTYPFPGYEVHKPCEASFREVVLTPGDVLYLPAGTWHRTEAEGYSFSLTLAQHHVRVSDFLLQVLAARVQARETGRRFMPVVPAGEASQDVAVLLEALAHAVEDLQEALMAVTPPHLAQLLRLMRRDGSLQSDFQFRQVVHRLSQPAVAN